MYTQAVQVKVTLPLPLGEFLKSKAAKYGLPVAAYIKHLILTDVADMEVPVFQASKKVEQSYQEAMGNKDKAVPVDDVRKFMKKL